MLCHTLFYGGVLCPTVFSWSLESCGRVITEVRWLTQRGGVKGIIFWSVGVSNLHPVTIVLQVYGTLHGLRIFFLLFKFYCVETPYSAFVHCSSMSLFTCTDRPSHSPVNQEWFSAWEPYHANITLHCCGMTTSGEHPRSCAHVCWCRFKQLCSIRLR